MIFMKTLEIKVTLSITGSSVTMLQNCGRIFTKAELIPGFCLSSFKQTHSCGVYAIKGLLPL